MVKSYRVCPAGLNNKRELAAEPKYLVVAIRHAHRQSSGGRDLICIAFEVVFLVELGAPWFFFGD